MTARLARLLVIAVLALASCQGSAPATAADLYLAAANKINADSAALVPDISAAIAAKDPARLGPVLVRQADIDRTFSEALVRITGATADQMAAINDLVKAESAVETLYRRASGSTTFEGMVAALSGSGALEETSIAASNVVRLRLGLPAAPAST